MSEHLQFVCGLKRWISLTAVAVMVALLLVPQQAQAYTIWFKYYDINMNELNAANPVDINVLQQGIYVETYYDTTDGAPLADGVRFTKPIATVFDIEQIDAAGVSSSLVDSATDLTLVTIYDDYARYKEEYGEDAVGGIMHNLRFVKLNQISPGASVRITFALRPYDKNRGGLAANNAGTTTLSLSVSNGSAESDSEAQDPPKDQQNNGAEEPQVKDDDYLVVNDGTSEGMGQVDDAARQNADSNNSNESDGTSDKLEKYGDSSDSEKGESHKAGVSARSPSKTKNTQGDDEDDDDASALSNKNDTENGGGGTSDVQGHSAAGIRSSGKKNNEQKVAESKTGDERDREGSIHPVNAGLDKVGSLFVLKEAAPVADSRIENTSSRVNLDGFPILFVIAIGILVGMAPFGVMLKLASNRKGVSGISRLSSS